MALGTRHLLKFSLNVHYLRVVSESEQPVAYFDRFGFSIMLSFIVFSQRVHSSGVGAETYTELLQKNMTPYISTQVTSYADNCTYISIQVTSLHS